MKLNYLILIFVVLSSLFLIGTNCQFILIEQYEYQDDCSSINDSSSSDRPPICNGETLVSGELIPVNQCIVYTNSGNRGPSIYNITDGNLYQTIFNGSDTQCQGDILATLITPIDTCTQVCDPNNIYGQTFQISAIDSISIPSDTLVTVWYSGACDGEFKSRVVSIYFSVLNKCNFGPSTDLVSFIDNCNSTMSTSYAYAGQTTCIGTPTYFNVNPIENVCSEDQYLNVLQICNNNNGLL